MSLLLKHRIREFIQDPSRGHSHGVKPCQKRTKILKIGVHTRPNSWKHSHGVKPNQKCKSETTAWQTKPRGRQQQQICWNTHWKSNRIQKYYTSATADKQATMAKIWVNQQQLTKRHEMMENQKNPENQRKCKSQQKRSYLHLPLTETLWKLWNYVYVKCECQLTLLVESRIIRH